MDGQKSDCFYSVHLGDLRPLIFGRRSSLVPKALRPARFVRAACRASIEQSTSGRQTSICDQSIFGGAWLLGWLPGRSGLIGTEGMNSSRRVGRRPDSLVEA